MPSVFHEIFGQHMYFIPETQANPHIEIRELVGRLTEYSAIGVTLSSYQDAGMNEGVPIKEKESQPFISSLVVLSVSLVKKIIIVYISVLVDNINPRKNSAGLRIFIQKIHLLFKFFRFPYIIRVLYGNIFTLTLNNFGKKLARSHPVIPDLIPESMDSAVFLFVELDD
jgi:hypothetical protein